jgi:hypothetical protein
MGSANDQMILQAYLRMNRYLTRLQWKNSSKEAAVDYHEICASKPSSRLLEFDKTYTLPFASVPPCCPVCSSILCLDIAQLDDIYLTFSSYL